MSTRSFNARLDALEQAAIVVWQAAQAEPARIEPPPPPAFDAVLAEFTTVLNAIDQGKCSFWCGYFNSCAPTQAEHSRLCWPCQFVTRCLREYNFDVEPTVAAYRAWIVEHARWIAFTRSRTNAELEALATANETDELFWTAAQRRVMDDYARLMEGHDDAEL